LIKDTGGTGSYAGFREKGETNAYQAKNFYVQATNRTLGFTMLCGLDGDKIMQYRIVGVNTTFTLYLALGGWIT
jgi:hypothetical protein